jgi:general secretion pathway protein A
MYTDYFGLREHPFNNTPDPRFFLATPEHEEALASLIYAVSELKGYVLLTGEVGTGKTLVARVMLRHFQNRIIFANINHAVTNGRDLLESICTEFDLPFEPEDSTAQLVRALHDFLLDNFGRNRPVVLILDEAQNLPIDAFEQLRMIGNLEADDAKLLQVVIIGQPELQKMFLQPQLRQLRQRVYRTFHLPGLDRTTTERYIKHRLKVAGAANPNVFDAPGIERVYAYSQGLPRLINTLCDNAMLTAYAQHQRIVNVSTIDSVIQQMMSIDPAFDTPHVAGEAGPLAMPQGGVESLATRIQELERKLEAAQARRRATDHLPALAAPSQDQTAPLREELASLRQTLRDALEASAQRLDTLEGRLHVPASMLNDLTSAQNRVQSMVREAEMVIQQVNTAASRLEAREHRIQELTEIVQQLLCETRGLAGKLEHSAERTSEAECGAQRIYQEFIEQAASHGQLAEAVEKLVTQARQLNPPGTESSVAPGEAEFVQHTAVDGNANIVGDSRVVRDQSKARPPSPAHRQFVQLLDSSRSALHQLRSTISSSARFEPHSPSYEPAAFPDFGPTHLESMVPPVPHTAGADYASSATPTGDAVAIPEIDRLARLTRQVQSLVAQTK